MSGVVVIGEGEKDDAPMLYNGEQVGDGTGPECDVAVDPIDGTTLTAKGMANAIAVMAVADRGSMYDPSAVFYMEKLVTGPEAADVVDIRYPVAENIHRVAKAKGSAPEDVTVVHPRPAAPRDARPRRSGRPAPGSSSSPTATSPARSWPARDGTGVDLLLGIGGTPEGIIAACAMKCLGGVDPGPAVAQGRRGAAAGARRRPRPRPDACCTPTTWSPATTSSSSPPASPTASCCAACATAPAARPRSRW